MPLSEKAKKFYLEHYGQLVGFTVKEIGIDESDADIGPMFALVLEKGKQKIHAFISQDEEGNGPGFLEIENPK